jgi:FkbM family methyltransferase
MSWVTQAVIRGLGRRGLAVQRHPAWRRQALLATHRIDTVFDVGAARGGFAKELRQFGYAGRIVSFEPMAAAYADLSAAAGDDASWTTLHTALGDAAGRQTINIASNSDSSSLLAMEDEHRAAAPHVDYVGTEEIDVARLDDVAPAHLPSGARSFLKIDTQGFEKQVLAGGATTLASCLGLQLELSFVPLYSGGMLVDEAVSFAYDAGFELVAVAQGFTSPRGPVLQADGVFFRRTPGATSA